LNSYKKILFLAGIVFASLISGASADPTTGWTLEKLHYEIQSPYNLKHDQRYGYDLQTAVYHFWVFDTDNPNFKSSTRPPRTEMSIDKYTSGQHQFEADVLVVTNTSKVSIMQIFGGDDHHATSLQLRVYDGNLKEYDGKTLLQDIYGKWFHLNVTHDVTTHEIQVFINGKLVLTMNDNGGKEWHFKCGVYAQQAPSHKMEVFYRNIHVYKK